MNCELYLVIGQSHKNILSGFARGINIKPNPSGFVVSSEPRLLKLERYRED